MVINQHDIQMTKASQVYKVQKSMKPRTEKEEQKPNTATQSRRVLKKKSLRFETNLLKKKSLIPLIIGNPLIRIHVNSNLLWL